MVSACNSTPAPNNERMHQKFTKTRRTPLWSLAGSALADLTDTSTPPFFAKMARAYKFEIKKSRRTTFLYPATYTKHPIHVYPPPKQLRRRTLSSKLRIDHASHHKTEARSRPFNLLLLNISSAHWTLPESFMQSTNRSRLYLTQMDVARS